MPLTPENDWGLYQEREGRREQFEARREMGDRFCPPPDDAATLLALADQVDEIKPQDAAIAARLAAAASELRAAAESVQG